MRGGYLKPNLTHKRKALIALEGLLEIVGLVVMAEGVRHLKRMLETKSEFQIVRDTTLTVRLTKSQSPLIGLPFVVDSLCNNLIHQIHAILT